MTVPFVELAKGGSSTCRPSQFLLFTLNYLSEHAHLTLTLLVTWNLHCYVHFAVCIFVCLIELKCVPYPSNQYDCFRGLNVILREWKGGPWSPELLVGPKQERDLIWKGGPQTPFYSMCSKQKVSFLSNKQMENMSIITEYK